MTYIICHRILLPAVHLIRLRVAPILQDLHIIEEQANDIVCLVQLPFHLCCVLSWFPSIQQADVLQAQKTTRLFSIQVNRK